MGWSDRSDEELRCKASVSSVSGKELIARFLTNKNSVPEEMIFKRDQITLAKDTFSDACGESSGLSVNRCADLTNAEIKLSAKNYAEAVAGRTSQGALVACVQSLRDIRLPTVAGAVVRVYDDGSQNNPRHAVLRATDDVTRPRFNLLRQELIKRFSLKVKP